MTRTARFEGDLTSRKTAGQSRSSATLGSRAADCARTGVGHRPAHAHRDVTDRFRDSITHRSNLVSPGTPPWMNEALRHGHSFRRKGQNVFHKETIEHLVGLNIALIISYDLVTSSGFPEPSHDVVLSVQSPGSLSEHPNFASHQNCRTIGPPGDYSSPGSALTAASKGASW